MDDVEAPAGLARGKAPDFYVDDEWLASREEDVLEPELEIVDPHHHLWDRSGPYLIPELLTDLRSGHNIAATVYVECGFMHRDSGDINMASIGEVEYANGVGAAFSSGYYGSVRACAGIVGKADLRLGASAELLLQACISRAPDRFRGIRQIASWDASREVRTGKISPPPDLFLDPQFREGFAKLAPFGLSFDACCFHTQLPQLIDLVDAFPDTKVIVNHIGGRISEGPYANRQEEVQRSWEASMQSLAQRPNVYVKIGGLNGVVTGVGGLSERFSQQEFAKRDMPPLSTELEAIWRPDVETCISLFGTARCMFESNFPVDKGACSATVLWNTYKRICANYSESEKIDLFSGTARRVYRLMDNKI